MKFTILKALVIVGVLSSALPAFAEHCTAHTTCWNGREIWCQADGESCTWENVPHQEVVCVSYSGPNHTGEWKRYTDSCY